MARSITRLLTLQYEVFLVGTEEEEKKLAERSDKTAEKTMVVQAIDLPYPMTPRDLAKPFSLRVTPWTAGLTLDIPWHNVAALTWTESDEKTQS